MFGRKKKKPVITSLADSIYNMNYNDLRNLGDMLVDVSKDDDQNVSRLTREDWMKVLFKWAELHNQGVVKTPTNIAIVRKK